LSIVIARPRGQGTNALGMLLTYKLVSSRKSLRPSGCVTVSAPASTALASKLEWREFAERSHHLTTRQIGRIYPSARSLRGGHRRIVIGHQLPTSFLHDP